MSIAPPCYKTTSDLTRWDYRSVRTGLSKAPELLMRGLVLIDKDFVLEWLFEQWVLSLEATVNE